MLPAKVRYIIYIIEGLLIGAYAVAHLKIFPRIDSERFRLPLLILFCVLAGMNLFVYRTTVKREGFGMDYVIATEKPLADLSEVVPDISRVGFVTTDVKRSSRDWMERYYLTRYALAPRIVDNGTVPDWVIFNGAKFDPKLIPSDRVLVRDFGSGVMLFRKKAQ